MVLIVFADSADDFLRAQLGDIVIIEEISSRNQREENSEWWCGYVIHIEHGARELKSNSFFQAACIDTGTIRTVSASLVKKILIRRGSTSNIIKTIED